MYQVHVMWNREFRFVPHGPVKESISEAIKYAQELEDMGERVREAMVTDLDGNVVYIQGRLVETSE